MNGKLCKNEMMKMKKKKTNYMFGSIKLGKANKFVEKFILIYFSQAFTGNNLIRDFYYKFLVFSEMLLLFSLTCYYIIIITK